MLMVQSRNQMFLATSCRSLGVTGRSLA